MVTNLDKMVPGTYKKPSEDMRSALGRPEHHGKQHLSKFSGFIESWKATNNMSTIREKKMIEMAQTAHVILMVWNVCLVTTDTDD